MREVQILGGDQIGEQLLEASVENGQITRLGPSMNDGEVADLEGHGHRVSRDDDRD